MFALSCHKKGCFALHPGIIKVTRSLVLYTLTQSVLTMKVIKQRSSQIEIKMESTPVKIWLKPMRQNRFPIFQLKSAHQWYTRGRNFWQKMKVFSFRPSVSAAEIKGLIWPKVKFLSFLQKKCGHVTLRNIFCQHYFFWNNFWLLCRTDHSL